MELTIKQEQGLKEILRRYKAGEKYTTIAGYAGTGKSTLVKFAIEALDVEDSKVAYAAFTGKAAEVLRKKGNPGACTLHKLLYDHVPKPSGGFFRMPKKKLDQTIIVVDEVSMVPQSMIEILLKHQIYIIFLGDSFQLPQINKKEENGLLNKPHIFLDEIMRQAAESEIIQIATKIRNFESFSSNEFNSQVRVLDYSQLVTGCYSWADQILVATNSTRQSVNNQMREMLGFSGVPQNGERMICLRNYWEDCSEEGNALVNGTTGIIEYPFESFQDIPRYVKSDIYRLPTIQGKFITDDGDDFGDVSMDKAMIETGAPCVDWRVSYQLGKLKPKIGDIMPKEFAYGYAITCHKAQGSEWDNVLVLEESFPFDKTEHARWLYTAATRAASRLVLVR